MSNRRYLGIATALMIGVGVIAWFVGCSITIDNGGGSPSIAFTLADRTITLSLGAAGVFQFTGGASGRNVADVVPFEKPPEDRPVSAVIRIRPEDVR